MQFYLTKAEVMKPIALSTILAGIALIGLTAFVGTSRPTLELSYTNDCQDSTDWQNRLKAEGFDVRAAQVSNLSLSEQQAMMITPAPMRDCKIGRVAGYSVIGEVPSGDIVTLLRRKPADVIALALDGPAQETVAIHYDGSVERRRSE
ncbi:MAG TPA: hypothetical protein DD982_03840 [Thalassospira sp.]|nr:hypothetical protein [Thalassospira sp.]MBA07273.1 hypothetical protein [Thalassospira sp.]OHZ02654.1 hypothetical protein BC440_20855 [Thalassospira sp. MIT1004]HBS21645.1 hypothetical protein [Thalassospira sp.]